MSRLGHAAARTVRTVDAWQRRRRWAALPTAVLLKYRDDRASQWAVLLTYYGFLSLLPALLVLVTGLGFVLAGHPYWQQRVLDTALADVPVLGQQLRSNVSALQGSVVAVVVGTLGAMYGAGGVLRTAHGALDAVSGVPQTERAGYLRSQVRVLLVGGSVLLTLALAAAAGSATSAVSSFPVLARAASLTLSVVLAAVVLVVTFRFLTSVRPGLRAVAPGALAGAVGWAVLHVAGGLYLSRVVQDASLTYGAFAVVIGLLAWLYVQAQLFMIAAEVNSVVGTRAWPRSLTAAD